MATEKITEAITLKRLGIELGNERLFEQGDVSKESDLYYLLKKAGGKPDTENLEIIIDSKSGYGKPEYIYVFDELDTILLIECKKSVKFHESENLNRPRQYAVDGALFYAKHLKEKYNVIILAVSGTKEEELKVSSFEWRVGHERPLEYSKGKDVVLELENYLRLYKGERIQRKFSLDEIRTTAVLMHEKLREIKMTERTKPIFIAGILMALNSDEFENNYFNYNGFNTLMDNIIISIKNELSTTDIQKDKIDSILQAFKILKSNTKLRNINPNEIGSLRWYISELDNKIKPMMQHAENTLDALGVFYHEFIKYSGGDGQGLGIILTPQHLTEFMCDLVNVSKNDRVVDICCGSGSFLITAMTKMFKQASNQEEIERIRSEGMYGVEFDSELYTLALANMIIRKDGKSNIKYGDCFNTDISKFIKSKNCTIGLMNPPYSQKDKVELEFVEQLLSLLVPGGKAAIVVPMSCAIGTKFKEVRERLFKKHTLKAVFSMPDDIFYPTATNVCVMVWEAHKPHNVKEHTYFGYFKDDGFIKRKKLGRIDYFNKWEEIKNEWLRLYKNLEVKDGFSAKKAVTHKDEWLAEAYMKTDWSLLKQENFEISIRDYLSYLIKSGRFNDDVEN